MITREQWLTKLGKRLESVLFKPAGNVPKNWRVTCGWPSSRALSTKKRTLGECWPKSASDDKTSEIVITMALDNTRDVAGIMTHEMVHVATPGAGHGPVFRQLALAVGLCGKMTATGETDWWREKVDPILEKLGPYPHSSLNGSNKPKQSTRLIKVKCPDCGYIARVSSKWIVEVGAPCCPDHGQMDVV